MTPRQLQSLRNIGGLSEDAADEIDQLQADLAAARALRDKLLPGYCTSTGISDDSGHAITIHYATREDMERAHEALCDAADAALAGENRK